MPEAIKTISIIAIMRSQFWFKALGTTGYTALFFSAYLHLLNHPYFTVTTLPATWLDRAIGIEPAALPVYLSLWCYVSLAPLLMLTRKEIIDYGIRMALPCAGGLLVFLFWPTAVPPAEIDWARYPGMAFLKGVDAAGNACPSLHVATAVFTAVWLHVRLQWIGLGVGWRAVNLLWCLAIAYSTLATRQHVALDVAAGIGWGLVAAWLTHLADHARNQPNLNATQLAPA